MRDDANESNMLPGAIAWLLALYLVPFCVIFVDELVLKTNWISNHTPGWFTQVVRTVYWPLIWVVKQYL